MIIETLLAIAAFGGWICAGLVYRALLTLSAELDDTVADLAPDAARWRHQQRDAALREIRTGAKLQQVYDQWRPS